MGQLPKFNKENEKPTVVRQKCRGYSINTYRTSSCKVAEI